MNKSYNQNTFFYQNYADQRARLADQRFADQRIADQRAQTSPTGQNQALYSLYKETLVHIVEGKKTF